MGWGPNVFHFVMIKPSHYDDDGYPISVVPVGDAFQHARLHEQPRRGRARSKGPRRDVDLRLDTYDETNRRVLPRADHPRHRRATAARALVGLVGVQSNQFPRARRYRPPVPRRRHSGRASAGFTSPAASRCCRRCRRKSARRRRSASRCSPAKRRSAGSTACCSMHGGELKPLYNYMDELPSLEGEPPPFLPRKHRRAHVGQLFQHRPRPRLPLPMLVLHHHQRAGPQEPLPHARRPRTDHPRELGAGHRPLLHHRRQFRPQQRLGILTRPDDQAALRTGHQGRLHDPGRHAVPQDPELHREGDEGRRDAACSSGLRTSIPTI